MSLKTLDNIRVVYTTEDDIYGELINPLLKRSKVYTRGVAYFHCEWLILAREGLDEFIENGGVINLLTSIAIDPEEYAALKKGEDARLNKTLKLELIDKVQEYYQNDKQWALDFLSYLVSVNKIEIRVSIHPENITSIYHDKLAFFKDEKGYTVCVHGSLNDSLNALSNHESLDVFFEDNESDKKRIESHKDVFKRGWEGKQKTYRTFRLPQIIKKELISLGTPDKNAIKKGNNKRFKPKPFEPRDYQNKAINALSNNDWNGILEMATGTGKTLTSLFAAEEFLKNNNKKAIVIAVPQIHLIYQWKKDVEKIFPKDKILICAENKSKWSSPLFRETKSFPTNDHNIILLASYHTLIDETFNNALRKLGENVLYIFDECHVLGSPKMIQLFKPNQGSNKIGLSATPSRWLDESGNYFITNTIGKTVYEYTLKDAIENEKLSSYDYHPHLVELTLGEFKEYNEITKKIGKLLSGNKNKNQIPQYAERLLLKRSRITKSAKNKTSSFLKAFEEGPMKYTIVYVYNKQVEEMVALLRKKYNLKVHGIVAETPITERNKILEAFNNGDIDVLVAIKCLDEGVDVENCTHAYILSSSTNPREFIQRRGRVLRRAEGKRRAVIHDFATIAPKGYQFDDDLKQIVIKRELPRVAEFARLAMNKPNNDKDVVDYTLSINILDEYSKHDPWQLNQLNSIEKIERNEDDE